MSKDKRMKKAMILHFLVMESANHLSIEEVNKLMDLIASTLVTHSPEFKEMLFDRDALEIVDGKNEFYEEGMADIASSFMYHMMLKMNNVESEGKSEKHTIY